MCAYLIGLGHVGIFLLRLGRLTEALTTYFDYLHVSRHDHKIFLPLPLLASKASSGCFKVSRGCLRPTSIAYVGALLLPGHLECCSSERCANIQQWM